MHSWNRMPLLSYLLITDELLKSSYPGQCSGKTKTLELLCIEAISSEKHDPVAEQCDIISAVSPDSWTTDWSKLTRSSGCGCGISLTASVLIAVEFSMGNSLGTSCSFWEGLLKSVVTSVLWTISMDDRELLALLRVSFGVFTAFSAFSKYSDLMIFFGTCTGDLCLPITT